MVKQSPLVNSTQQIKFLFDIQIIHGQDTSTPKGGLI